MKESFLISNSMQITDTMLILMNDSICAVMKTMATLNYLFILHQHNDYCIITVIIIGIDIIIAFGMGLNQSILLAINPICIFIITFVFITFFLFVLLLYGFVFLGIVKQLIAYAIIYSSLLFLVILISTAKESNKMSV